jgi:hypothetical protein
MGYTKEQRLEAAKRKQEQLISISIMKELRELTGEPFDKLETYLKEEIPAETFKVESKSVLYRKIDTADNELNSKRVSLLRNYEGELRIRLIDVVVKNNNKRNKKLRLLCFYEVRTRYFDYKKIDHTKSVTIEMLMTYIESIQRQNLKFPISCILITQKIIDEIDLGIFYWNVEDKEKSDIESFNDKTPSKNIIQIEQKNFPVKPFGIEIDEPPKLNALLLNLNAVTEHHQGIAKKRLRQHQRNVLDVLKDIGIEKTIASSGNIPLGLSGLLVGGSLVNQAKDKEFSILSIIKSLFGKRSKDCGNANMPIEKQPVELTEEQKIKLVRDMTLMMIPVFGIPLKIYLDLAEEINREKAEENETDVIEKK